MEFTERIWENSRFVRGRPSSAPHSLPAKSTAPGRWCRDERTECDVFVATGAASTRRTHRWPETTGQTGTGTDATDGHPSRSC